jgi:rhodanese-related sulfurtransferase/DNA-binding transcriptional ArsR family regulator
MFKYSFEPMNDTSPRLKQQMYEQLSRIGKGVANPHRLELIDVLAQGERRVDALAHEVGLSVANTSLHLQALQRAGLIERRRVGTEVRYRIADPLVLRLWQAIRAVGEARLAEMAQIVQQFISDRRDLEAVDAATLRQRMVEGTVVVLDVRPELEYRAGHLPGARSMPVGELLSRLRELPRGTPIVAYCRGPYCVMADEAVQALTSHGYQAARLEVGLPEWRDAGLPVERDNEG